MNKFRKELTENILPFWIDKMQDNENGGFYGRIDGADMLHPQASKAVVLNCRILWTFSAAYRILNDKQYLKIATRAYDYVKEKFIDKKFGGVYWELDYKGNPINTKKQVYAQGFAIYGFAEYYRATGFNESLDLAIDIFKLIEQYKDHKYGGYFEAFTEDWRAIEDMRLSEKDFNEKKSMNTHLHVLESYTNLLRIWKDARLTKAQKDLIGIFRDKIIDSKTFHQHLFFGDDWTEKSTATSYGHDIEASWLLFEAAEVLNDKAILNDISQLCLNIANAATEGLLSDGSMIYETDNGHTDKERHWWVQAEAVVGFLYAYKISHNATYKENAKRVWEYIQNNIVDNIHGEWHWSRLENGDINKEEDKAGPWKCPYHNSRMCIEVISNLNTYLL